LLVSRQMIQCEFGQPALPCQTVHNLHLCWVSCDGTQ
jgi:hypothetical protein